MKKIFAMVLSFVPVLAFATENIEGTYIGSSGKKVNLSSYEKEGTFQYQLVVNRPVTGDARHFVASEPRQIKNNGSLVFTVPDNPYAENETSSCQIKAIITNGKLEIQALSNCNTDEKAYSGQYAYSEKSSNIPSVYQGKWGDCSEPTYIKNDSFSADGYYNYGLLGYEVEQNKIILNGFSIDEGEVNIGNTEFTFLNNNQVKVKASYEDTPKILKQCR